MARYVVTVRSPMSPEDAFAYMADLANFAEWDPGVVGVELVEGEPGRPDAAYDVTVEGVPRPVTLRYRLVRHQEPTVVVARAESSLLRSVDTITVRRDPEGSEVTYEAELTLKGPFGLAGPLLGPVFRRIGDKAAAGLIEALAGTKVPDLVG